MISIAFSLVALDIAPDVAAALDDDKTEAFSRVALEITPHEAVTLCDDKNRSVLSYHIN